MPMRGPSTHILLHVLLSSVDSALAHLKAQRRSGVVYEVAERGVHAEATLLLRHAAALLAVAIGAVRL